MNRQQRRAAARNAVKGKGARDHFAKTWKGMCDSCLMDKCTYCSRGTCTCKSPTHRVQEKEVGEDAVKKVSETESGLVVVRKKLGSASGPGVGPGD